MGLVGDIKRRPECGGRGNKREQHNETRGGDATDAQNGNINLRTTPWWWNGRNGAQVKSVGFAGY